MPIDRIDHVNIRTADLAGTVAFFRDVLGMEATPAPGGMGMDRACWLRDANGEPAIHVGELSLTYPTDGWRDASAEGGTGPVHHVALQCSGYDDIRTRLAGRGLPIKESDIREIGLRQIFVAEPSGILLELNFWAD